MKRIKKDWNKIRKVSLWRIKADLHTITIRDGNNRWYAVDANETEATYDFNRIIECLDTGKEFIVTKKGNSRGERVITDRLEVENYNTYNGKGIK